ncbi:uroporphyrinogen-III C-methyltransferase [Halomonas sp.]|uniref:uroporphyrinogen-III C-methyltransferase n=1 Tax=Halomonas sp. TaxID=1486246 RepID=UPI00257F25A2|nr:uroporphyrinogen-III C-methyltransferase [Halomonas sp.]MCJ8284727.1 uroporphyrinogen-III C-methyltransferase [Halomonas sp.]NQY69781.1 uroporphyrinogen-III C-methyltransferase [Halomonas sp.]
MSNQQHDQDEQQTPSASGQQGTGSATSGTDASKGGAGKGGSQRRSRRRDKSGSSSTGSTSSSASAASSTPAAATGSSSPAGATASSAGTAKATPSDAAPVAAKGAAGDSASKPSASKPSDSKPSASKPDNSGKASAGKPGDGKPGDGKPSDTKASGAKASDNKASDNKPSPAAGKGGNGGASAGGAATSSSGGSGSSSGGGKAGVVALVLVLILIAGVAFVGWKGWQLQQAMSARIDQLKQNSPSVAEVQELSSQLESGLAERRETMGQAVDGIKSDFDAYKSDVNQTLDRVLAELSKEQNADERDWLHAEAAYLLRLANQRLQLERDVEGAAALLRTADARLEEANNPALVPVRRAIAEELAALQTVPKVDRTGLYLALNAQQEQIAGLPLAQDIEQFTADTTIEEAPSGAWQEQLARVGEELKELVTVRHHDQALEALITPEQESYLRQSLRLVLEQSQLALLKEETGLYEASLDKAITLLEGYYDVDDESVQSVIARLGELKGKSIRPELPDISASQQALARFIEQRFEAGASGQGDNA